MHNKIIAVNGESLKRKIQAGKIEMASTARENSSEKQKSVQFFQAAEVKTLIR